MRKICIALLLGLCVAPVSLWAQGAVETQRARIRRYPAVWPAGPAPGAIPSWAGPGKMRFSRWDGGRIETAKAFLSGWPGLNPPNPDYLYTMTNWYDPKTVRFAKQAGLNLVWVTLSVGFSDETEAAHREEVRRYIDACHREGIRVMAYESIGNMFWEDMFEKVPESKTWVQLDSNGKPIPYSAATFKMMGRITRYMANLSHPAWRALLMKRIDLAIESGADGIMYDNNFGATLVDLYQQIMRHALSRKRDFLVMANFHKDTYVLNRLLNCITTEDGIEPGLYSTASKGYADLKPHYPYHLSVGDKKLINNFGLMRIHETLSEGWKPVMIEASRREHQERMSGFMSPQRSQLAMAEAMMFGAGYEHYVEGKPAHLLSIGDPEAVATWQAIGKYNRFFAGNEDLYVGAQSKAPLGVILDDESAGVELLDGLAARGVPFEVLYEKDVDRAALSRFKAIALLTARSVRSPALSAMEEFARKGGRIVAAGDAATLDENGVPRARPSFLASGNNVIIYDRLPGVDQLAATLREVSGEPPVALQGPPAVLWNLTVQPRQRRTLVHILNYTLEPIRNVRLKVQGAYSSVRMISPDGDQTLAEPTLGPSVASAAIPELKIYSVVALDWK